MKMKDGLESLFRVLEMIGFSPDDWQKEIVRKAESSTTLGVSIPRQNGKTECAIMLGLVSGLRGDTALFCGHAGDVVREAYRRACVACEPLVEAGVVRPIKKQAGILTIDFVSGGRFLFRIRSASMGVGLTVDRIIFDEAQKMTRQSFEDILPITTTSSRRSVILMGTPPTDEDLELGTTPFIDLRRKRKGRKATAEAAWVEWGIGDYEQGHTPWTLAITKRSNPAWKRIPNFSRLFKEEVAVLEDREFARQRLGAWVLPKETEAHDLIFTQDETKRALGVTSPQEGSLWLGIGLIAASQEVALSASDGRSVEVITRLPLPDGSLAPLADWLEENGRWRRFRTIVVPATPRGKALKGIMSDRHVDLKSLKVSSVPETATAIDVFRSKVRNGALKIWKNDDAVFSLGSCWLGYDSRSQSAIIRADDPVMESIMISMILSMPPKPLGGHRQEVSFA